MPTLRRGFPCALTHFEILLLERFSKFKHFLLMRLKFYLKKRFLFLLITIHKMK
ncbi:hypothetical protein PAMA110636_20820 [Paenibacillus macerans]